ncbi:hypothetical protein CYMTET_18302 [Cymbomonas tetramitiformis]|uniref:Uncharacterized protein n=1 Tax=Cymbomonas tetramitiformis TaxID=36881 RepID=A0AAE0G9P7_9CHLO|nr:hypothetical protein CYMTET_18302 [Cymbomonas tetramitiformis]
MHLGKLLVIQSPNSAPQQEWHFAIAQHFYPEGCDNFKASSPRTVYPGKRIEYVRAQTVVRTLPSYPLFMDTGDDDDFVFDSACDHRCSQQAAQH